VTTFDPKAFGADLEAVGRAAWDAIADACRGRRHPPVLASHAAIATASAFAAVLIAATAKAEGRLPARAELEMLVTAFRDGIVHNLAAEHGLEVAKPSG
jgi:hypothetical protein